MYQDKYQRGAASRSFQAYSRMRIPHILLPHVHQIYVINAIRDNKQVDPDDLYARAIGDFVRGKNGEAFAELGGLIERSVTGKIVGSEVDSVILTLFALQKLDLRDEDFPNVQLFNHKFLNDRGIVALVTVLTFDAAQLDAAAMDRFRGGENLTAAYGPRRTRQHKETGKSVQELLKQFASVDEPAYREAAQRYVEYRFRDLGNFQRYLARAELSGNPRSERHLRDWFRRFDDALGYSRPARGRPKGPNTQTR